MWCNAVEMGLTTERYQNPGEDVYVWCIRILDAYMPLICPVKFSSLSCFLHFLRRLVSMDL